MANFDKKEWLDKHVVPLLAGNPPLRIYHPFWDSLPPKNALVILMAGEPPSNPSCTRCGCPKAGIPGRKLCEHTEACDCPRSSSPVKGLECASAGCTYDDDFDPAAWPRAVKRLLDKHDFRFDFTREQIAITFEGGLFNAFGGDGAPLFSPDGMASVRLYRKVDDGIGLIAQIACSYKATAKLSAGEHACAATKAFFALFEENPLEVCQKYGALFGQA